MDIKEEKIGLIEWIDQINDVEVIHKIKKYVEELSGNEDSVQLSVGEKKALEQGLKDFEEGNVLTDEEVRKRHAKYFK